MPDAPQWDLAAIEAADDSLHKKRVQGILEAALGKALKLMLEGKMSQTVWDQMEQAITSLEQSGAVTVATIAKLSAATVDPVKVTAGAQRVQAVVDAMQAAAAAATVAAATVANGK